MDSRLRRETVRSVFTERGQFRERLEGIGSRIRSRFEIDTRALAATRIALGIVLLVDLLHRAGDVGWFYTDDGVYPLTAHEAMYGRGSDLLIHATSGELWFQQLAFAVAGLFAVAFVLGYRTRLVGFASLALLVSLHGRNPAVLNGGDRLLRVLLLVALLTPLGERWSLDALRRGSARSSVAGVGTAALLLQPVVVFTSNAIQKHRGDHWYAGDALEVALHNDVMTVYLGDVIVEYPELLTVLDYAWVTLLAGSCLFLFAPVGRARALAAIAYAGAFAGMLATMAVGLFPLALTTSVIPFLTTPFWDALARRVPSRWTDRLPAVERLGPLGRPPLERRVLGALRRRGHDSAVSVALSGGRSLLTCLGVAALVWMLLFAAHDATGYGVPDEFDDTQLDQQQWGLYAPDPASSYSWYVVEADLANGTTVDALDGGSVDFDRPPDASEEYDTFRHRKFMQWVRASGAGDIDGALAEGYADWACERADSNHDGRVEWVTVYRMVQPIHTDGEYEEPRRLTVVERDCGS